MAEAKKDHVAEVLRLWQGGERANAIAYAEANKVKAEDWPDGMAQHIDRINKRR